MQYLNSFVERLREFFSSNDISQPDPPLLFELHKSVLAGEYYSSTADTTDYYPKIYKQIDEAVKIITPLLQPATETGYDELLEENASKKSEQQNSEKIIEEDDPDRLIPEEFEEAEMLFYKEAVARALYEAINNYKKLVQIAEQGLANFYIQDKGGSSSNIFDSNIYDSIRGYLNEWTLPDDVLDLPKFIFQLNLAIVDLDLNLDCRDHTVAELYSIIDVLLKLEKLVEENSKFTIEILADKCHFLLAKIFFRKHKLALKDGNEYEATDNLEKYDTHASNVVFFKAFISKAEKHYKIEHTTSLKTQQRSLKDDIPCSVEILHNLNRAYRKGNDLDKIKELKKKVDSFCEASNQPAEELLNDFNSISLASARALTNNSILHASFEKERRSEYKQTLETLRNEKLINLEIFISSLDLKDYFLKAKERDYYPYKLLIYFFQDLIAFLLKEPFKMLPSEQQKNIETTDNIEKQIEEIVDKDGIIERMETLLNELNKKYYSALQFSKSKKYKPVYLGFNECLIVPGKSDKTDFPLFVDSAYVLPDDYARLEDDFRLFKTSFRSELTSLKHVVRAEYNVKYFEKHFKKELESKEFKAVQVLAMFITVATLILGTIKAFEGRTLFPSLAIISALAFGLLLFNYFIYLFIKGKNVEVIISIAIGAYIAIFFLLGNTGITTHHEEEVKKLRDVINQNKNYSDSSIRALQSTKKDKQ